MRTYPTIEYSTGDIRMISVEEKGSSFYDEVYRREKMYGLPACDSKVYPIWLRMVEYIGDDERVLDLGCGTGQFAQVLLNHGKKFLLGVDFSPVAIEKAKSLVPFGNFMVGDLYKSYTYDHWKVAYDCVTLCEVMEHIEHDNVVLGHIKKGAHVVFTVPNYLTNEGSHVRGFLNEGEIRERYGKMIEIKNIEEVVMNRFERQKVWIVDGVRRETM